MASLGVPQACESTAVVLDSCSRKLRAYGQAIVRSDLNEAEFRPVTVAMVEQAIAKLTEVKQMLEPRKAPKKAGSK